MFPITEKAKPFRFFSSISAVVNLLLLLLNLLGLLEFDSKGYLNFGSLDCGIWKGELLGIGFKTPKIVLVPQTLLPSTLQS